MDPNAALKEIREILVYSSTTDMSDLQRAAEVFEALDNWLCRGGFLPDDWKDANCRLEGR